MIARPRLHRPSILGRIRSDPGPLLLIGLVVALTTALTSAVGPLLVRTSDHALADVVRQAGSRGFVVATFPGEDDDYAARARDPLAVAKFRDDVRAAQHVLPKPVAASVRLGTASAVTPDLHLLGGGPGRYLGLAYLEGATGVPRVRYTSGGPPRASVGPDQADVQIPADAAPWPVQVAVSQRTAAALGLRVGDRLTGSDEHASTVAMRVSGIFEARDAGDDIWQTATGLLDPVQGVSEGVERTSATALVSAAAFPDLGLAVPANDLTERVALVPRPDRVDYAQSAALVRAIVSLKASPGVSRGFVSWDSELDHVLTDGRAQVAAARGQADVLLVGLLACALLVLWQAADLLVRRRAGFVTLTRERGGTLLGIAAELAVEVAGFAVAGAALGFLLTLLVVGDAGWGWWVPVPFAVAAAAGVTAARLVSRSADPRRTPANRAARRVAARTRRLGRVLFGGAVLAAAVLSFVALRERGVVGAGSGDPTAASAPVWWSVAGALLVVAMLPVATRLLLDATRRTSGGVAFFVAARLRESGARALPLLVVVVTVAQLTFAISLAITEQRGQATGALLSVGGDARVSLAPGPAATGLARRLDGAPGVRAAVAARVEDDVRAVSRARAATVRLVVVDASSYEHLLAVSALPDAPRLARLEHGGARVPALLLGGPAGLRDGLTVRGADDRAVPLRVVGTAPRVQGSRDPVVVVDAGAYARAGGDADPDTVWVVGPGSAAAVRMAHRTGTFLLYADVLAERRHTPLARALVRLAFTSAALLLLFAALGVAMAASSEAVARGESLGRLRALGVDDRRLWGILAGELVAPVVVGAVAGLLLGVSAAVTMFGQLSLGRITGQVGPTQVGVPAWVLLSALVLLATALVLSHAEWRRLRGIVLGQLLRR